MSPRFLAVAGLLAASLAAHADTMYTVSLSSFYGGGGTGTLTVDLAPGPDGTYYSSYAGGGEGVVRSLDLSIDGFQFDTPQAGGVDLVLNGDGQLTFLQGILVTPTAVLDLQTDSTPYGYAGGLPYYAFEIDGQPGVDLGFVGVSPPTTPIGATPEPSSFALLGTGLLGVTGFLRKRSA